jgi:hypothetical protein
MLKELGLKLERNSMNHWTRKEFGPGYQILRDNAVIEGCCQREFEMALEQVEDYIKTAIAEKMLADPAFYKKVAETYFYDQRRAAKGKDQLGATTFVSYGQLLEQDRNYGAPVDCYACSVPHKALGLVRIENKQSGTADFPLCEPCFQAASSDDDSETGRSVMRKFLNDPALDISEGGEATREQVEALSEKTDQTEH